MIQPFIVTHDEKVCIEEGRRISTDDEYAENWQGECNYRYLVWAESHLEAARWVQAHKKELGRVLPEKYTVFGLRSQGRNGELHCLGDGDQPEDDKIDLDMFEEMFDNPRTVNL